MVRFNKLCLALTPLAFLGINFLTVFFYPIGQHSTFCAFLKWGIMAVVLVALGARVLLIFRERPEKRRFICCVAAIPLFFSVLFLLTYLIRSDLSFILKSVGVHLFSLTLFCLAAIIVVTERAIGKFCAGFYFYAWAIVPIVFFYCVRLYLPNATGQMINLGEMDYMSYAYMLFTLVFALTLNALVNAKNMPKRRYWGNYGLCVLFSAAIALSGTKGACISVCFFCVLTFVYILWAVKKHYIFPISTLAVLLCFSIFLFPSYNFENRAVSFLKEIFPFLVTETVETPDAPDPPVQDPDTPDSPQTPPANTQPGTSQNPGTAPTPPTSPDTSVPTTPPAQQAPESDELPTEKPTRITDILRYIDNGTAVKMLDEGIITREEYEEMLDIYYTWNNSFSGARILLWKNAWAEFKDAPIFGNGPYHFWHKYGTYPHNFIIELVTDFGLIFTLAILAAALYFFLKLLKKAKHSAGHAVFLLYALANLPQMMISGTVYSSTPFFLFGFLIILYAFRKQPEDTAE